MEDLLRDDEFVVKEYFNHWKYFAVFYAAAVLHMVFFYFFTDYIMGDYAGAPIYIIFMLLNFLFPIMLAIWMILGKRKTMILGVKTLFLSLLCLAISYFAGMMLLSVIDNYMKQADFTMFDVYVELGLSGGYLLLFSIIVIPIATHKSKQL